jgi:sigma-E factor negative regulatory protein RseA
MEQMQTREMISALADGQLRGDAFARGVELVSVDAAAREAWQTYHLIGDVMRSGELAAATAPAAFLARFQLRLQQEQRLAAVGQRAHVVESAARPAANDASFQWKLVAGFASLAAVAAICWTVVGGLGGKTDGAQLAAVPAGTVLAGTERGAMIRDPQLDELLAAHRQLGGATALQTPAGFLRNATFDGPGR